MTKTHRTKGRQVSYNLPNGKCDMCGIKPAAYWYGNTSVALCGDEQCAERNERKYQELLDEINSEDR
jgi:hypothetical protein